MVHIIAGLSRKQKRYVFLTVDLILIPLSLLIACVVHPLPAAPSEVFYMVLPVLPYLLAASAITSLWLGLPSIRLVSFDAQSSGLAAILVLVTTVLCAVFLNIRGMDWPAGVFLTFGAVYFLCIMVLRVVMLNLVQAVYRRASQHLPVLIYGAGSTGTQLAQALKAHERIDPVGFVDDNRSLQGMTLMGLPVYSPARISDIVSAKNIKRILLAMPSQGQPKQAQIINRLDKMGLEVQVLPSFAQLIGEEPLEKKLTPVAPQAFLSRSAHTTALEPDHTHYTDRVVLVSGAGGSIGSELCRQVLAYMPTKLVLFEISEFALYAIYQELKQLVEGRDVDVVAVLGSVTDSGLVKQVLAEQGVQVVLHAAAYKHVPLVEANPLVGLSNNVFGTQTLAREAANLGVERFILISSDKAVRPTNVMGASKRLSELVVHDLASRYTDTSFAMVRFGNVLGSSGSVVPLFQEQISRGGPVTITDTRVKRYFMTLGEAVQLVLTAGSDAQGGEVFVLDMGEPVSILQLARQVIERAGYSVRDADTPDGDIEIDVIGLRPGEKLEEELTLSQNLMRTRHPKIFCVQEDTLSEIEVASMLHGLRDAVTDNDSDAARNLVERWVEGYRVWQRIVPTYEGSDAV
jgi:FlaA1/EpsC-like NDP-sugar epimerase